MASLTSLRGTLARAFEAMLVPLCKLNQIQFDAPWNPNRRACG